MTLDVRGEVDPRVRAELEEATRAHRTLEDVVRWGLGQEPALIIEDVVVQDEYTHDVVLPCRGGVYLVYDTT